MPSSWTARTVIAKIKTPTTEDVTSGITTALRHVLETSGTATAQIAGVMIGTTHFTNAVVERRRLEPTAAVRLGLPATAALPPFVDWPDDLADALGRHAYLVHGGHEFDGREISPLDAGRDRSAVAADLSAKGITAVAVSSVFSPVNTEHGAARRPTIITAEAPEASVTISSEIGRIGLLERENAAILNACLRGVGAADRRRLPPRHRRARHHRAALPDPERRHPDERRLRRAVPGADLRLGPDQLDARRGLPLRSQGRHGRRRRRHDVDVGALTHGFPREASVAVDIGGVRTNFRMPDVYSFGLGGGSLVREDPLHIGPQSVGYRITQEALVFGGDTLTTTDIAVAAGAADIGDAQRVADLDPASRRRRRWSASRR